MTDESAERYLREHEREFRRFTEHAREVFWISDPERSGTVYVNPAFEAVWGRPREAFFEEPSILVESVHPEDRDRVEDAFENKVERGGFDELYRIQRPDGEIRWIHDRAFPVHDGAGELDNVVGIAADVTERRRVEEELRRERERADLILDTSPVTILVLDADRRVTFGNERAKEVLGAEELVGTPFSEFPWELLEGDEPVAVGRRPFDLVRKRDGPVYDLEYPALVGGERRWLSINGAPLYDDGEFDGAVFVTEDVTDRKRREAALSTLHEANSRMARADSGAEIGEVAVAAAAELLPTSRAAIYAIDTAAYALRPVAHTPEAAAFVEDRPEIADDSPLWRAFVDDESCVGGSDPAAFSLGHHGVLVVLPDRGEELCAEDASLARVLCDDAATALERTEREAVLREQRGALRRSNEKLEQLTHVIDLMRGVTQAIVGAGSREEVARTVCERLAAAESYQFAWIGERSEERLEPEAWAGVPRSYLDGLELSIADGDVPAVRTARDGEPVVERRLLSGSATEHRSDALSLNYRAVAAVPLRHRGLTYGVLCVYADRPDAFGERERDVLCELGETIGYAIDAIETRNGLLSDGVTELRLRVRDADAVPHGLAEATGSRIEHRGLVPRDGGRVRWYASIDGATPTEVYDAAAGIDRIESVRPIDEANGRYELLVRPASPNDPLVEPGTRIESMTSTPDGTTVTLHASTESSVRTIVESLRSRYREVELLGRRDRARPRGYDGRRTSFTAELTDRQREILRMAYYSGYFEEPRETTGAELADRLGVNRSTFHRTLRAAERASFASLLD